MPNNAETHSAYKSICLGYSEIGGLFVKHFNSIDFADIGEYQEKVLSRYLKLGAKKQFDILKEKIKTGEWSENDNEKVKSLESNISLMASKRSKASIESQLDEIDEIIDDYNKELRELLSRKNSFFVHSAESYADSAITDFIIYKSFFIDKNFNKSKFDLEDVEHFEKDVLGKYIDLYSDSVGKIGLETIKHIAINPKFYMFFEKSGSIESFYGIAGVKITRNQMLLFDYCKYYSEIIPKISDLSEEERGDPDKIEKAFIVSQNQENKPKTSNPRDNFAKAKTFKLD